MDRSIAVNSGARQHRRALAQQELERALEAAKKYANKSRSEATWRAYRHDWRQFENWCALVERASLPADPETVALFISRQAEAGLSPSTLSRRLAAIRLVHLGAGHPSPHNALKVAETLRGVRRDWSKPLRRKKAALAEDVKRMVDTVEPETLKGMRDRALVLIGFAGAFRRSELVALNTENLEERSAGLKVTIERSKTDQEGRGQAVAIMRQPESPYCPVQALNDWTTCADIQEGALFRRMHRGDKVGAGRLSAQSVALVVKDLAARAELNPADYAGHSLRSGFLTSAARARASVFKMADQSRHKSLEVLRQYVRDEELFDDNAGEDLLRGDD